jgi:hypothetical protein
VQREALVTDVYHLTVDGACVAALSREHKFTVEAFVRKVLPVLGAGHATGFRRTVERLLGF